VVEDGTDARDRRVQFELRDLESFVVVATERSFTAASCVLRFDQSTISRHVAQIERDLRVVLLSRSSRWVELTDAGRQVLPDVRRFLAAAKRAADLAETLAGRDERSA
jgi:DNA-binding transcriptional LysR family regulator